MKIIDNFLDIRKNEWPMAISMFTQFFCIITGFWIFKPLKKSLFLEYYDQKIFNFLSLNFNAPQAELVAKVANLAVAIVALGLFSFFSQRYKREKLSYIFTSLMLAMITYFGFSLQVPNVFSVWTFYLFGDLYLTILLVTFFSFLNDIVTTEQAKRLYGPIFLGGVLGGVVATSYVKLYLDKFELYEWMIPSFLITAIIIITSFVTAKTISPTKTKTGLADKEVANPNSSVLTYLKSLTGERYLLGIMAMVGLYEMISTIMDFQFSSVVSYYLNGPEIGQHISLVFAIVNWTSLLVQLFLTSFILTRLGTGVAISILPVAVFGASAVYIIFPVLWIASLLPLFDNALKYSIYQSAYETLYVPLEQDVIYRAKSFIDIFIVRWAKVLAIGLSLLISMVFTSFESIRWISFASAILIICWLLIIRLVVKRYRQMTS